MARILKSNRLLHLQTLYEVGHRIHTTFDLEEILQMLAASLLKDLGFDKGAVVYLDKNNHKPHLSAYVGFSSAEFRLLLEHYQDLIRPAIQHDALRVESVKGASSAWLGFINQLSSASVMIVPLRNKSEIIGFIIAAHVKKPIRLTEEDRRFFRMYAIQSSTAIVSARLYEELGQSALTLDEKVRERTRDLLQANEQLRSLDQIKTNFIRMISHELRTPLTSIKGFAVTLYKYDKEITAEKRRVYLEVLNEETDRLTRLITELLDISRLESGQVEMFWQSLDLPLLVKTIFSPAKMKAGNVTLEAHFPDGFPKIMADAAQIEQVLVNLIENAVKFSPPNGVVRVQGCVTEEGVQIDVVDQGPGIPSAEQDKIFEKFYREDNEANRRHPGTGLGLAICRALVALHGGRIWLDSEPEQGCRMHVSLPSNLDKTVSRREAA